MNQVIENIIEGNGVRDRLFEESELCDEVIVQIKSSLRTSIGQWVILSKRLR